MQIHTAYQNPYQLPRRPQNFVYLSPTPSTVRNKNESSQKSVDELQKSTYRKQHSPQEYETALLGTLQTEVQILRSIIKDHQNCNVTITQNDTKIITPVVEDKSSEIFKIKLLMKDKQISHQEELYANLLKQYQELSNNRLSSPIQRQYSPVLSLPKKAMGSTSPLQSYNTLRIQIQNSQNQIYEQHTKIQQLEQQNQQKSVERQLEITENAQIRLKSANLTKENQIFKQQINDLQNIQNESQNLVKQQASNQSFGLKQSRIKQHEIDRYSSQQVYQDQLQQLRNQQDQKQDKIHSDNYLLKQNFAQIPNKEKIIAQPQILDPQSNKNNKNNQETPNLMALKQYELETQQISKVQQDKFDQILSEQESKYVKLLKEYSKLKRENLTISQQNDQANTQLKDTRNPLEEKKLQQNEYQKQFTLEAHLEEKKLLQQKYEQEILSLQQANKEENQKLKKQYEQENSQFQHFNKEEAQKLKKQYESEILTLQRGQKEQYQQSKILYEQEQSQFLQSHLEETQKLKKQHEYEALSWKQARKDENQQLTSQYEQDKFSFLQSHKEEIKQLNSNQESLQFLQAKKGDFNLSKFEQDKFQILLSHQQEIQQLKKQHEQETLLMQQAHLQENYQSKNQYEREVLQTQQFNSEEKKQLKNQYEQDNMKSFKDKKDEINQSKQQFEQEKSQILLFHQEEIKLLKESQEQDTLLLQQTFKQENQQLKKQYQYENLQLQQSYQEENKQQRKQYEQENLQYSLADKQENKLIKQQFDQEISKLLLAHKNQLQQQALEQELKYNYIVGLNQNLIQEIQEFNTTQIENEQQSRELQEEMVRIFDSEKTKLEQKYYSQLMNQKQDQELELTDAIQKCKATSNQQYLQKYIILDKENLYQLEYEREDFQKQMEQQKEYTKLIEQDRDALMITLKNAKQQTELDNQAQERYSISSLQTENFGKSQLIQTLRDEITTLKTQRDDIYKKQEQDKQNLLVSNIDGRQMIQSLSLSTTKDAYISELQNLYEQLGQQDQDMNVLINHVKAQDEQILKLNQQNIIQQGKIFGLDREMSLSRSSNLFQKIRVSSDS